MYIVDYMAQKYQTGVACVIVALLILGLFNSIPHNHDNNKWLDEVKPESQFAIKNIKTANTYDVPNWRIGDKWIYDSLFDVSGVLTAAEVDGSVDTLYGTTENEVTEIKEVNINGTDTLVYVVEASGSFTSGNSGASLEGFSGRVDIDYEGEDLIRVSDLATINITFSLEIDFYAFNFLRQEVADLTLVTEYEPAGEGYDFPLSIGEAWDASYNQSISGSGESDYFEADSLNEETQNNNTYLAVSEGTPAEDADGDGNLDSISYSGCSNSIKVEEFNETGDSVGYRWYCDSVRSYAWNHLEFGSVGMTIDWMLEEYIPAASQNVVATSDPGTRNQVIDIGLQAQLLPLDAISGVWANYSSPTGLLPAQDVDFRFEPEKWDTNVLYSADSAFTNLESGSERDDTPTTTDWASHGLVAWEENEKLVGARTIILDENVVGLDIAASPNVLIERTRGSEVMSLTEVTGFNAIPGDSLNFNVGAINVGLQATPSTTLILTLPDGTDLSAAIPSLMPLQQARVDVEWTVPQEYQIGTLTFYYEVTAIPNEPNTDNNDGSFNLFIGRLPVANWQNSAPDLTLNNISFDATASNDPDGGDVMCHFIFGTTDGETSVDFDNLQSGLDNGDYYEETTESCIAEMWWEDDGVYVVGLLLWDDEDDIDYIEETVEVINRAPWLNLSSVTPSIPVETSITIDASDSGDLDSNPSSPLSIQWNGTTCQEGGFDFQCTITPFAEGPHTITAFVTDDDGVKAYSEFTFNSLNVAPSNIGLEATFIEGEEIPQQNGIRNVPEGTEVMLAGTADDTDSDKDALTFNYKSTNDSAGNEVEWESNSIGSEYVMTTSWAKSGPNYIHLTVTDDDGESISRTMNFNIINVPPIADDIPAQVPIGEEDIISINGTAYDTENDMESLVMCWDLNPMINADEEGDSDDDCDIEGETLHHSWTEQGLYKIIFHVTDDDGASDSVETTINVVNRPPKPAIEIEEGVKIQDSAISFSANGTTDSAGDLDSLIYRWDFDTKTDSDGDGIPSNDNDATGLMVDWTYTIAGEYTIRLEVEDKDGQTGAVTQSLNVTALETGLFSSLTEDSSLQVVVTILAIVFFALIVVLLVTRFRRPEEDPFENMRYEDQPMSPPPVDQMVAADTAPTTDDYYATQTDSMYAMADAGAPAQQPEPVQQLEEPVNQGPPLPPAGLPEGWTMEQWSFYGEQYLAKSGNTNTENTNYSQNTSESSSDLDLDF